MLAELPAFENETMSLFSENYQVIAKPTSFVSCSANPYDALYEMLDDQKYRYKSFYNAIETIILKSVDVDDLFERKKILGNDIEELNQGKWNLMTLVRLRTPEEEIYVKKEQIIEIEREISVFCEILSIVSYHFSERYDNYVIYSQGEIDRTIAKMMEAQQEYNNWVEF